MKTQLRPFLMFQGDAEQAMKFYVSLFEDGEIHELTRHEAKGPGRKGSVMRGVFSIAGQTLMCTDSVVDHAFSFTPSPSLFVDCELEAQIEGLFNALSEGGAQLMPLGEYGFSRKFGWLNDRFGVSWQLNLP